MFCLSSHLPSLKGSSITTYCSIESKEQAWRVCWRSSKEHVEESTLLPQKTGSSFSGSSSSYHACPGVEKVCQSPRSNIISKTRDHGVLSYITEIPHR